MELHRIDFESMEWESPADCVKFKAYQQDNKKMRLVEFSKELVEPDWCAKGHIGYILEGKMEIDFDDGAKEVLGPGDGVFIPTGQQHKHKGRVLTDKVKAILVEEA